MQPYEINNFNNATVTKSNLSNVMKLGVTYTDISVPAFWLLMP